MTAPSVSSKDSNDYSPASQSGPGVKRDGGSESTLHDQPRGSAKGWASPRHSQEACPVVGPSWPVAAASLGPALAWHTAGAPCLGLELLRIHCQHLGVSSAQPGGASP